MISSTLCGVCARLVSQLDGGARYANGVQMTPQAMTSICGYIIQEDLFIGTLTVKEHLTFLVSTAMAAIST